MHHESLGRNIPEGATPGMEGLANVALYTIGEAIYRYGEPADHWYRVVAGAARKYALTPGGSRHIVDFLLPGDLFGLAARSRHCFSVEAITDSTAVARYALPDAERLADTSPEIGHQVRDAAFDSIRRTQSRMVLLGRASAVERVGIFLLEMTERYRTVSTDAVVLPMSRYDIADYLAMAVETVSRALTRLRCDGIICLTGVREVRICDHRVLRRIVDKDENLDPGPRLRQPGPGRTPP